MTYDELCELEKATRIFRGDDASREGLTKEKLMYAAQLVSGGVLDVREGMIFKKLKLAVEALEFYANRENHGFKDVGGDLLIDEYMADDGFTAQEALKQIKG